MALEGLLPSEGSEASRHEPASAPLGGGARAREGTERDTPAAAVLERASWLRVPARAGWVVLLIGLLVTAALSLTCQGLYGSNENRLLGLRARELGLVVTAVVPALQTPLASAAELADVTGGNPQKFRAFMAPYVGPGRLYASASLWHLGASTLKPTAIVGDTPALASLPGRASRFFARDRRTALLSVIGMLGSPTMPTVGYAFNTPGVPNGFAAYAETQLPADRRTPEERN